MKWLIHLQKKTLDEFEPSTYCLLYMYLNQMSDSTLHFEFEHKNARVTNLLQEPNEMMTLFAKVGTGGIRTLDLLFTRQAL